VSRNVVTFWSILTLALQIGCASSSMKGPIKLRPHEAVGPPAQESARPLLEKSLHRRLQRGQIQAVQWRYQETTRGTFESDTTASPSTPIQVLQLADAVSRYPLSEVDGVVTLQGAVHAATALHRADGRVIVHVGAAPLGWSELPHMSADALRARYRLGPFIEEDGRAWSRQDLRSVATALSFLSESELVLLEGLTFVRDDKSSTMLGLWRRGAYFQGGPGTPHPAGSFHLLDLGADLGEHYIAGPPDRAYPYSSYVMVHEFGHAIANMARLALINQAQKNVEVYGVLQQAENSRKLRRQLGLTRREVRDLMEDIRDYNDEVKQMMRGPSPMELAFSSVPGALPGPTPYGRTSVSEAFAEAFALYHVDPPALGRISPLVLEWFESGEHMKTVDYAGWTLIREILLQVESGAQDQDALAAPVPDATPAGAGDR
jgi:hypothetical protein